MPKIQTDTSTDQTAEVVEAAAATAIAAVEPSISRKYGVEVLPDGRVRATLVGIHEETDELNYACSQERTVRFMLNDVAPVING